MPLKLKKILLPGEVHVGLGMRNIKTAVAVVTCLVIYEIVFWIAAAIGITLQHLLPFHACTAAIICMQNTVEQTWSNGFARMIGTLYGGLLGILVLFISTFVPSILEFVIIGLAVSLIICLCNLTGQQNACSISCVVMLAMVINHEGDPEYILALYRLIETITGIIIAALVNRFFFIPKWIRSLKAFIIGKFQKKK